MSAVYRAPVFFITSLRAGWLAAVSAMVAETAFRVVTSGFYGAATQAIRTLEPAWLAVALVLVVAPLIVQVAEYGFHLAVGTAHARTGVIVSSIMTALASLFNWYAMRHHAMLTGSEARPFSEDLKRLPSLILRFIMAGPAALLRMLGLVRNGTEKH